MNTIDEYGFPTRYGYARERRKAEKRARKEARRLQLIAKARLNKAAPKLLEMCELVIREYNTDELEWVSSGIKQVEDAIRMAKEGK